MIHRQISMICKRAFPLIAGLVLITAPMWVAEVLNQPSFGSLFMAQSECQFTPQAAYALIQSRHSDPNLVILDVRTSEEYQEGYIENAINLDYHQTNFQQAIDSLDRTKTYLVYCRSGVRSSRSLMLMKDMEFSQVYDLQGGIEQWQRQGFQTVQRVY